MIHITYERIDEFESKPSQHDEKIGKAFQSLVEYELGFGGVVTILTPTKIVVKTPIFSKMDISTFEGDEAELRPLVEIASLFVACNENKMRKPIIEAVSSLFTGKSTLVITHFGPFMLGSSITKSAVICYLAEDSPSESLVKHLSEYELKELIALASLVAEGNKRNEVMSLL
jgi:hypothetical protein